MKKKIDSLTDQQKMLLIALASGRTMKQAATRSWSTVKGAEYHWGLIKVALGITNYVEAAHLALHLKLIPNRYA